VPVKRRLAFVFPGFEAMPVAAHRARFVREAKKTAPVYGMRLEIGETSYEAGAVSAAVFPVAAVGEGWSTETEVVVYGLADLSDVYAMRNPLARMATGLVALGDFVLTGTFFRFVATSWRYCLFFAYPLVLLAGAVAIAAAVGLLLPGGFALRTTAAAAVLAGVLWFASARMHFLLMMDDWSLARDVVRERRADLVTRIDRLAREIGARMARSEADEVLFAAHSFGAITAVLCLAKLLRSERPMPPTGLLTVGSSLLKAALHPAAGDLRAAVATVASSPVAWLDVQSLTDPLNFYRSNPAGSLGVSCRRPPRVMLVRFREQLQPATYRAIKRNFFRVHRQFVYATERRSDYSFHAIICGPEPFAQVADRGGLAETWPADPAARAA
jgi:hypothetical protein